ncbi:hypothetical protein F5882DRAFT_304199, partial [Hyaloscypha sp. PMI_1271]
NPTPRERDLVIIEINLKYYKGTNKKPKPITYLFREEELPILYLITYIIATALRDNAIQVNDRPIGAEPFFTINLKDPIKVIRVY